MDAPDQPSDPYGAPPPDVPMRRPDGRPGGPGGGYGRADRRPSRRPRTAVVATVVAAVIVLAVTLVLANRRSNLAPDGGARSTGDNSAIAPPPVFTPDDNARVPPGNASGAPPQPAEPTPSGEPEPTKPAPPPGPPPPNPPPARVTLHTLDAKAEADGPSGKRVNSVIGLKRFPQSTSVFVNCSGRSATLTYQLGGDYTRLTTTAGLTGDATPGNLVARMSITGDGRELSAATVSLDRSEALSVDVKGVRTMVVSTRRAAGTCRRDNQPYGVLGNASLLRR